MNYIEHLLVLVSIVPECVLISAFAPLVAVLVGITNSAIRLKFFVITARIKKYKSIIKKKKKKHDQIVLLAKSKLNIIEVLISKVLIDSNISHNEFVLINYVLKNMMIWKKKSKSLKINKKFKLYKYIYIHIYINIYIKVYK